MKRQNIEQLKSSVRIEEVIGRYVRLNRQGQNYRGLCPFHEDRHPSFTVNTAKQQFTCFACGEHGDVIGFIQKINNCSFSEALDKLNLDYPFLNAGALNTKSGSPNIKNGLNKPDSEKIKLDSDKAKSEFLSALLPYVCGESALTPTYLDFEVGQSPVQVPREWYAMRNRIIFPIRDEEGRLAGFAARRLTDANVDEPKYINSSAAAGFHKGELLYGLYRAIEAIRKAGYVFLTEGYKDVIAMHAAGFIHTVALGGTALTTGQVTLLKKYTDRVYLLLDGDKAGREAARKIALSLPTESVEVHLVSLPEGEDPDSLFRRLGKERFRRLVERYQSKPDLSEALLLAACLTYQKIPYPFKGTMCLFPELLNSILQTDDLLFEHTAYRTILSFLAEGKQEADLPEPLKEAVFELHTEQDSALAEERSEFAMLYPDTSILTVHFLTRLLFLYCENRILRDIRDQVCLLLKTSPDEKDKRTQFLIRIANRREQLRHVAENLERPGTVWFQ